MDLLSRPPKLKDHKPSAVLSLFSSFVKTTFVENTAFLNLNAKEEVLPERTDRSIADHGNPKVLINNYCKKKEILEANPRISCPGTSGLTCSLCTVTFSTVIDQREHFRLDWHRFNLKRHLAGENTVKEEEFEKNCSDLSSISGSDTEDESSLESDSSDTENKQEEFEQCLFKKERPESFNRIHFCDGISENVYSMFRTLIHGRKSDGTETLEQFFKDITESNCIIVSMMAGGHFAAGIYHGETLVEHKTFHRYTIRAKRGTVQSAHDGSKFARSAGASIRRHNEAALSESIKQLFEKWSSHVNHAALIFLKCPVHAKSVFFGKGRPFQKGDSRMRKIPFMTRRPTLKEVQRVFSELTSIHCYENAKQLLQNDEDISVNPGDCLEAKQGNTQVKPERNANDSYQRMDKIHVSENSGTKLDTLNGNKNTTPTSETCSRITENVIKSNPETEHINGENITEQRLQDTFNKLNILCDRGNSLTQETLKDKFEKCFTENCVQCGVELNEDNNYSTHWNKHKHNEHSALKVNDVFHQTSDKGHTLLHRAALAGNHGLVWIFLEHGADPSICDNRRKTPYELAKTKEVRNTFRRFMAEFPSKYDYGVSQIPSPLTAEMEEERSKKANEKKKAQKKNKKEREKAKRMAETPKTNSSTTLPVSNIHSEREKRAAAAERRYGAQLSEKRRCANCTNEVDVAKSFRRFEFLYCSVNCVQEHRFKIGR